MALTDDVRLRFDHVSIAVKSIDRAYEFFEKYFPIKLRSAKSLDEQVSGSFYWQDFHLGGFVVELIEDPVGKPGFVTKFIERHGEGMHHLSIETDGLDKLVANLKAGGVRVVDEQKYDSGSATAFISPRSAFGALIQFWHTPNWEQTHPKPAPDGMAYFDHVSLAVKDIKSAYDFFTRYFPGTKISHEIHTSNSEGNFDLAISRSPASSSNSSRARRTRPTTISSASSSRATARGCITCRSTSRISTRRARSSSAMASA